MSDKATMRMKLFNCHVRECKSGRVEPLKWEAFKRIHCRGMVTGMTATMIVDMASRLAWSADRKSRDKAVCDMFDGDLNITIQQVANKFGMTTDHVKTILMNR